MGWFFYCFLTLGAKAVLPVPEPRVCSQFFNSDLVAVVDVLSSRIFFGQEGGGEAIYTVRTAVVFRGYAEGEFEIRAGLNSARGSLVVGATNLVFAVQHKSEFEDKQAFFIYRSSNTGELVTGDRRLQQVRELLSGRMSKAKASVRGYVYPYPTPIPSNAKFVARSKSRTYSARADSDGWFEFHLPSGVYDIIPENAEQIMGYDLSYNNPKQLHVETGRCYEVAFRGRH